MREEEHASRSLLLQVRLGRSQEVVTIVVEKILGKSFKQMVGVEPTLTCFITNMIMLEMNHAVQFAPCFYLFNVIRVITLRCTRIVVCVVSDVVNVRFQS